MDYRITRKQLVMPVLIGLLVGFGTRNFAIGVASFATLLLPALIALYIPYAKDNPRRYWFKRKIYGWGWTPVTWQGWLVTAAFILLILAFASTLDENSPPQEVAFMFVLPLILLSTSLIRIAYVTGEKPRWQWGVKDEGK